MEKCRAEALHEDRRRSEIEARLPALEKDNQRLLDMLLKGIGEQGAIDARMKAQGQERDRLKQELARLPQSSNVVVHPAAVKAFADRLCAASKDPLRSNRAKLEMTLTMLDDMGELSQLVRELIQSVTLYRDEERAMVMRVEGWLEPFLQSTEGASKTVCPKGAGSMVAGDRSGHRAYPYPVRFLMRA